jgi:hypothetical protein
MSTPTSPTGPRTSIMTLKDITLVKLATSKIDDSETVLLAGTLWELQPCLILVLRRPGCLLCRVCSYCVANVGKGGSCRVGELQGAF